MEGWRNTDLPFGRPTGMAPKSSPSSSRSRRPPLDPAGHSRRSPAGYRMCPHSSAFGYPQNWGLDCPRCCCEDLRLLQPARARRDEDASYRSYARSALASPYESAPSPYYALVPRVATALSAYARSPHLQVPPRPSTSSICRQACRQIATENHSLLVVRKSRRIAVLFDRHVPPSGEFSIRQGLVEYKYTFWLVSKDLQCVATLATTHSGDYAVNGLHFVQYNDASVDIIFIPG
ncbi:uncharacterized protein V1510DRAFT_248494 [Dipodascopsis tothii]|uniref:uncharacterized protein n=1 Tax=Dipodascopsis tothii TaxID=44089 RepID=UPI0034CE50A1